MDATFAGIFNNQFNKTYTIEKATNQRNSSSTEFTLSRTIYCLLNIQ
jgi:hypothetical protein